jgi:prepilin-type N-terminal cleavage/methylation domain-containing protein
MNTSNAHPKGENRAMSPCHSTSGSRSYHQVADYTQRGTGNPVATPTEGFTLLEVLVALAIFAIVLSLLYGSWRILMQSSAAGLRLAANAQRQRTAIQTLQDALGSAILFAANARHYAFLAENAGGQSALTFVAHLSPSYPGSGFFEGEQVRRVTFTVEPDPQGVPSLYLRQNSILDQVAEDPRTFPVLLAQDVSRFEVGFWDPRKNDFLPEWTQTNTLPALVKVTLGFSRKASVAPTTIEVITRVIRIPSAGVAMEAQAGLPTGTTLPRNQ